MVIVELAGGLGNQMFQYAFAYSLAYNAGVEMKMNIRAFEFYKLHKYGLDVFNLNCGIADSEEIYQVKKKPNRFCDTLLNKLRIKKINNIIKEETLLFEKKFIRARKNIYLKGYFQCEKYFIQHSDLIRKQFIISKSPNEINQTIIDDINSNKNTISLHIRRGDYVSNPDTNKIHGTLGGEYYLDAIKYLEKQFETLKIYIFSDDISWAKNNLYFEHPSLFVDANDAETNYEDLRLMSFCEHNIIANSSFSWWGAWLNQNPNKIVIAPKQWFADSVKNEEAKDIVPDSWVKL